MSIPDWFPDILGSPSPRDGETLTVRDVELICDGGILRAPQLASINQTQTSEAFGFKWGKRDSFETTLPDTVRKWLHERYGDMSSATWLAEHGDSPVLLDAGCGAGLSALELWRPVLERMRYIGIDISSAIKVAQQRFLENGFEGAFLQCDLQRLPLPPASVDLIFSEGVLHHTDNTRAALHKVTTYLKPGGRILFYVYRRKGPIREFTDDYIRGRMSEMSPQEAWDAMLPLTRFGKLLGELNIEIDVSESIDLLDIPAGKVNLQRLFYWHIFKAYYRPEMTLDEMNHVNYDWYAPRNAHRQTPEQVREWCAEAGLEIEKEDLQEAGITIIARKSGVPPR